MLEKIVKFCVRFLTDRAIVSVMLDMCERLAAKTQTTVDDRIVQALRASLTGKAKKPTEEAAK